MGGNVLGLLEEDDHEKLNTMMRLFSTVTVDSGGMYTRMRKEEGRFWW